MNNYCCRFCYVYVLAVFIHRMNRTEKHANFSLKSDIHIYT